MTVKSDIEIARAATMKPIAEVAAKVGIPADSLIPYGRTKAKVSSAYIDSLTDMKDGKLTLGFDPSALTYLQFLFVNHFVGSNIVEYELLGIEHIEHYHHTFDVIFCLGVLYHRQLCLPILLYVEHEIHSFLSLQAFSLLLTYF